MNQRNRMLAAAACCALLALAGSLPGAEIKHQLPVVANVFPQGWGRDTTLEVDVMGEFRDRAATVVFLDTSIQGQVVESDFTAARLEFTVSAEAALGEHYFRLISPRGASNLMLFRVGDQPHVIEKEPNSRFESPEHVALPLTINARLNHDEDFDFYRFKASQGETWIFDLRAARNGNGLDAALILLDSRGRKLQHVEDHFIWDPFFAYAFSRSDEYTVVIQPTSRMNPAFAYQLDIRRAAHLDTVVPIAFAPGESHEALLHGAGLNDAAAKLWFDAPGFSGEVLDAAGLTARVRINVPQAAEPGEYRLAFDGPIGRSTSARFLVDATPRHTGGDAIQIPVAILGVAQYRRPESFFFDAEAGETLVFEVRAHRYGSPVDAVLRILDAEGREIAKNDDANFPGIAFNKDPRILYTFQQAGRYELQMRNLWKVTGEDFPYLLAATRPKPRLELLLDDDHPYVTAGGEGKLKVKVVRHDGFVGAVQLRVEGLPDGVTAATVEVPAVEAEGEIVFQAEGAEPGRFAQIKVVADQSRQPAWQSVRITSGGGEGATFASVEKATLAVIEPSRFGLEVGFSAANLVKGGAVEIPVTIARADGFDEPIRLSAINLPEGVEVEPATAEGPQTSVTMKLRASASVETGTYRWVSILGESSSGKIEEASKITVTID